MANSDVDVVIKAADDFSKSMQAIASRILPPYDIPLSVIGQQGPYCIQCGVSDQESQFQYNMRRYIESTNIENDKSTTFNVNKTIRGCVCQYCQLMPVVSYNYNSDTGLTVQPSIDIYWR